MVEKVIVTDDEALQTSPEICVWMALRGGLCSIVDLRQEFDAKKIEYKEYIKRGNKLLVDLAEAADATHRFDIVLPASAEPNFKKYAKKLEDRFVVIRFTSLFWRWYNWWHDYTNALPLEQRKHIFHLAMERVDAVNQFRPPGDWRSHRSHPGLQVVDI